MSRIMSDYNASHWAYEMAGIEDPRTLLDGLAYRGAITDSVINKKLWISKNMEFNTIFKLDRMARSVARSKKG
ncbi:MAG: hypothetical protein J7M30_09490 [Deltaproteobacteria bacterium]|nr:hypothetical protein [Deltaproteobacteria bacterium]